MMILCGIHRAGIFVVPNGRLQKPLLIKKWHVSVARTSQMRRRHISSNRTNSPPAKNSGLFDD